jgi:hypothetical protein
MWRITLPSHEAKAAEARMAIPRNDHMVVDGDTKQPTNLDDLLGHVDIRPGWRGIARRVVVDEDATGGVDSRSTRHVQCIVLFRIYPPRQADACTLLKS